MRGNYPWDPSSGSTGVTKEMLHLRLHKAQAEHKRCIEELQYLPQDAKKAMRHGLYQVHWLANRIDKIKQCISEGRPDQHLLRGELHSTVCRLKHRLSAEASAFALLQSLLA